MGILLGQVGISSVIVRKKGFNQRKKIFSLWRQFMADQINVWELLEDVSKLPVIYHKIYQTSNCTGNLM